MAFHTCEFPFDEVARFDTRAQALASGFAETQLWSVAEENSIFIFGPAHHYINVLYWIATKEHHDEETYYEEYDPEFAELDDEEF